MKFQKKLHLVNRPDVGTSGIVVVAKSKEAAAKYQALIASADKSYKALWVKLKARGVLEAKISSKAEGHKPAEPNQIENRPSPGGKQLTRFRLLDLRIETGKSTK